MFKGSYMSKILLFYKYVSIENPEAIKKWQLELCKKLNLKGRVILATEGINGTLGGSDQETDAYMQEMNTHPLFDQIDFKFSPGGAESFPRLSVKVKNEIVHLGLDKEKYRATDGGIHLEPKEVHELLTNKPENLVLIDTRNNYESAIGTFKNSIIPDTESFRDFPKYIDENLDLFKDKKVLMFCTGGVRCERASTYLKSKNVTEEVYQIKGGIHRYIEQFPDGFFRGKNYVFDSRITVKANDDILGKCYLCNRPEDTYTNCLNATCNLHYICCVDCKTELQNCCSQNCKILIETGKVNKRPWFDTSTYAKASVDTHHERS